MVSCRRSSRSSMSSFVPRDRESLAIEPTSEREMLQAAANAKNRVFVIFLDGPHVSVEGSHDIAGPLIRLMNRILGPDDLVGIMTPRMSRVGGRSVTTEDGHRRAVEKALDLGRALPRDARRTGGRLHHLLSADAERENHRVGARPTAHWAEEGTSHARSSPGSRQIPERHSRGTESHPDGDRRLAAVQARSQPREASQGSRDGHGRSDSRSGSDPCRAGRQAHDKGQSKQQPAREQDGVRRRPTAAGVHGRRDVPPRHHRRCQPQQLELLSDRSSGPRRIRHADQPGSHADAGRSLAEDAPGRHADARRRNRWHRCHGQQRSRQESSKDLGRPHVLLPARVLLDQRQA